MNIFITGATGFIGSHLLRRIIPTLSNSDSVYCLVRNPRGFDHTLPSNIHVLPGDHESLGKYKNILLNCGYIYHIAAKAELGNGAVYQEHNVGFTKKLIDICVTSSVLKRFIFISSIAAIDRMPSDNCRGPLNERSVPNPMSDYGKSKLACEQYIKASKVPYVILRPTWVYGPGMRKNSHVRVFIDGIMKRKFFSLFYFPGKVSLIYIDDLVDAILIAAYKKKSIRKTYFVSDGSPISIGDLFRKIGSYTGRRSGMIAFSALYSTIVLNTRKFLPLSVQNLFLDVLCANPNALNHIGFKPRFDINQGLIKTIRWHAYTESSRKDNKRKTAWITGGANGIGRQLAVQLYVKGYDVSIVDKDRKNLATMQSLVEATTYQRDLSDKHDTRLLVKTILAFASSIDVFINNAGIAHRGYFWDISFRKQADILQINCYAPILFSHTLLSSWVKSNSRHTLINIASSAAFQPMPLMSLYGSSKALMLRFSQSITGELLINKNINSEVITVSPSGTATNFQKISGVKNHTGDALLSPEYVASEIIQLIGKGNQSKIIGRSGKIMEAVSRLLPANLLIRTWSYLMNVYR